jgi:hypothetical protein
MTDKVSVEAVEREIQSVAEGLTYPPTPSTAAAVRRRLQVTPPGRQLAWAPMVGAMLGVLIIAGLASGGFVAARALKDRWPKPALIGWRTVLRRWPPSMP